MNKKLFAVLLCAILTLCALFSAISVVNAESEEEDPELRIYACSLAFKGSTYINYAVQGNELDNVKMLIWTEPDTEYEYGSQNCILESTETQNINGTPSLVFRYTKLNAKEMTDVIYARAFVEKSGTYYYSEVKKYSILQYAYNKTGRTGTASTNQDLIELLESMLVYGSNAQKYFKYKTDRLASDDWYQVKVVNGLLDDMCDNGLYLPGDTVTVHAPDTNDVGEAFYGWYDQEGKKVASTAEYNYVVENHNIELTGYYEGDESIPQVVNVVRDQITPADDVDYNFASFGRNDFNTDIELGTEMIGEELRLWGWAASLSEIQGFGYSIDNGEVITGDFNVDPEQLVIDIATGEPYNANDVLRFAIIVPVTEGIHTIKAYMLTEHTTELIWKINVSFYESSIEFEYENNWDGTCTITRLNGNTQRKVVIPATIDGLAVVRIGDWAFEGHSELTSIVIPDGVTEIGNEAFYDCTSLKSITIPDSVVSIRDYAFECCRSLRNIVIPAGVTEISLGTFRECSSLESVTIPGGVTRIGDIAFEDCSGLTSVVISDTVTEIGDGAFRGCSSLETISLPDSIVIILNSAFERCTSLTSITIPEGVTEISGWTFQECSNLASVTLPSTLTRICECAFRQCWSLESIVIPDGVTEIGENAFEDCLNLESVTIPGGVTRIGNWAFNDCSNLSDIYYAGTIEQWNAVEFGEYWDNNAGNYVVHCSDGNIAQPQIAIFWHDWIIVDNKKVVVCDIDNARELHTDVEICSHTIGSELLLYGWLGSFSEIQGFGYSINDGELVEAVFDVDTEQAVFDVVNGFGASNASRYSISIPVTEGSYTIKAYLITEYGAELFWEVNVVITDRFDYEDNNDGTCTLTGRGTHIESELVIPSQIDQLTVTKIGEGAFENCTLFTSIVIPDGVTEIGNWAFRDCSSLESITIPGSVTLIGESAFENCSSFTSVDIPNSVTEIGMFAFYGTSLESVTIPGSVTKIGDGAFCECKVLSNVEISNGVTEIGVWAFQLCSSLESVTIPGSIIVIGEGAFDACSSLTSIEIPAGVTKIENWLFAGCSNLESVTIPGSVTSIGEEAFCNCSELADIFFDGTIEQWNAIDFGENWDNMSGSFVVHCSDGDILKAQPEYTVNADGTCTITGMGGLTDTELVIPDTVDGYKVTAIGENAFCDHAELTSVSLPFWVNSIGSGAFIGCSGLNSVTFSEMVTTIAENAFDGCALDNVYFGGNEDEWDKITIETGNEALAEAEIQFNTLIGSPVATAEDFMEMKWDGVYYLTDDIELTERYNGTFTGAFNGNGHTISVGNESPFNQLYSAYIRDLTITGIFESGDHAGGLAARGNKVIIKRVTNYVNIISNDESNYIGGIIGYIVNGGGTAANREYSYFIDCVNNGMLTTNSDASGAPRIGGIVGNAAKHQWCVYENCVNNAKLEVSVYGNAPYVGGIAGSSFCGEFINCVNNGELHAVNNNAYIGGIVARLSPSAQGGDQSTTCTNCVNNGYLHSENGDAMIGGIMGFAGAVKNNTYAVYSCIDCVNTGEIYCDGKYVGGIIGRITGSDMIDESTTNYQYAVIDGCTNYGNITGAKQVEQDESGTIQEATFVSQFLGYTTTYSNEIRDSKGYGKLTNTNENYNVLFGITGGKDYVANTTISGIELVENDGTVYFNWCVDQAEAGDMGEYRISLAGYLEIEGNEGKIVYVPEDQVPEYEG